MCLDGARLADSPSFKSAKLGYHTFLCAGHTEVKMMLSLSLYIGKVLHSHDYRYAEPSSGQSVVVLGTGSSGMDISIELAKVDAPGNNTLQLCLILCITL